MHSLHQWKGAMTWNSSSPGHTQLECVSCMEKYLPKKCVVAPCSHVYCFKCIASLTETCLRDESIFPLKCCKQVIPTSHFVGILNTALRSRYEHKALEFSTSADWRIYCSNMNCSAFLGSSRGETQIMTCPQCRKRTCSGCKQAPHPGDTCRGNIDSIKVRQMARKERWQTCPGCSAIVEQKAGCNHMTCRCRTEFCYLCGVKWKQCSCPQFGDPGRTDQQPEAEAEVENRQGGPAIHDDDLPIFDYQYFLGDAPLHADFDDERPQFHYESSEDEGPYINPYDDSHNDLEQDEYDEDIYVNPYERTQDLLNIFLPETTNDNPDDEDPYTNPNNLECTPNTSYPLSEQDEDVQDYEASDEEEVYINPYGSVPDFSSLHIDDSSDDAGPYINPYDPVSTPPDVSSPVTYYSDISDKDDVYTNPYDSDPEVGASSDYYDSSDDY